MRSSFLCFALASLSMLAQVAWAAPGSGDPGSGCPPPEQPALSRSLSKMVADEPDDAMQCIIQLLRAEADVPGGYSDEVRYQLSKQSSDAIEVMSSGGTVFQSYHEHAANLWRDYLIKASPPLDQTRFSFGINKILQHSRYAAFDGLAPEIVRAMSKARSWLTPAAADQFFSTAKRCPRWTDTQAVGAMSCLQPCTSFGRSVLSALANEFGTGDWSGSDGVKRLAWNSKAFEKGLTCTP